MRVFVRWRPLSASEASTPEIDRSSMQQDDSRFSISIASELRQSRDRSWRSASAFTGVFEAGDGNKSVFETVVVPTLPQVLGGGTCNVFAYGHSGSGKTHTIIGYDYEDSDNFGLCLSAAQHLCRALEELNAAKTSGKNDADCFGLGIRMYELRKNSAFDLLNGRRECFVREGGDGKVHIRGETEVLEGGKVRVRPIVTRACWNFDDLCRELRVGLKLRATGSSSVHDESSRTHAVLELEIVTRELLDARDAVIERESELVPVGKRATDIYLEEHADAYIQTPDGKYEPNPAKSVNQSRIDAAEEEKRRYETFVKEAKVHEAQVFASHNEKCLGGKIIFVDLAGSEYYHDKIAPSPAATKMTPQERQEGRQINTDLLALKNVIRARALNQTHIPFRSSPLTMVLREHFAASTDSQSAMILPVSPSSAQFAATMNTLKYGSLVGAAGKAK